MERYLGAYDLMQEAQDLFWWQGIHIYIPCIINPNYPNMLYM